MEKEVRWEFREAPGSQESCWQQLEVSQYLGSFCLQRSTATLTWERLKAWTYRMPINETHKRGIQQNPSTSKGHFHEETDSFE